jgi:TIR domain
LNGGARWRRRPLLQAASHLFICYSSKDEPVAREIVKFLETAGLKCWISARDVPPGQNYQETIVQALESSRGVVFLFSESSSKSHEIRKELSIGGSINLPVFPIRLAPIAPSGALRYELAIRQWIDIFPNQQRALETLADTIKQVLESPIVAAPLETTFAASVKPSPAKKRSSSPRAAPRGPIVGPGTQEFEAIRVLLARHIGPIAKVLVEKAATEARTADEFCEQLAAHVAAASERTSFVRAVRAQLPTKA